VSNNLSQAKFNIVGPLTMTGQGNLFVNTNTPPGEYSVTWSPVAYYETPPPQTNDVTSLNTTLFTGTYTIIDTNNNGMSDAWERAYFGSASAMRTEFTDSDGDGVTDLGEFMAGTNPTNAASVLHFLVPVVQNTGAVRFDWPSVPGRSYRITSSADLNGWSSSSDWMRANGAVMSFTTNVMQGTRFYRVEAQP
jgi:hypothetical protein